MSTDQEQLAALDQELKALRADYHRSIRALTALQQGARDEQVAAFEAFHAAGLAYFNAHERAIPLDARLNMDLNPTCFTDRSETSANVLEVVATHYETLRMWADDLGIDINALRPSRTAFANMQRRVKETQPEDAAELRERFVALDLPTRGFDAEAKSARADHAALSKPHTINYTGCAIGDGARVEAGSINSTQNGDVHVGDKINIGGNVTGSAVGSNASLKARDIVTQIQQSGVLGEDLVQVFTKAAEALAAANIPDGDKEDVADDMKKLKDELEKKDKDEGRIKKIWDRINAAASTVASVLASAATMAAVVLGGLDVSGDGEQPDDIEQLLKGLSPENYARVKALLDNASKQGLPVSITSIGGPAIGCAIGSGAALTARDVVTALDGGAPPDDAAQRAAARFDRELSARKLADRASPDFAKTKYAKRLGFPNDQQQVVPLRTVGTFFALAPAPLIPEGAMQRFLQWMNCNERRYKPVDDCFFLPGPMPDMISKAHVWHNGYRNRFFPMVSSYTTYIAVELEEGYVEYGFCPGSFFEQDKDMVYYAKVVGGFVAFLRFLRDFAETFGGDPSAISVGLAMRGTLGSRLRCITKRVMEHFLGSSTPEEDGFLWMNAATPGTDWSLDRLARQAAVELLDHWSYTGPAWADTPEFTEGKYTGDYYRADFHGQWY